MKKFLLVIMVVAIASFLFVGCDFPGAPPVTPPVEPPVEPPVAPTATIAVVSEFLDAVTGKNYVQKGSKEITVTFTEEVENPLVKVGTTVIPVFTVDKKVYKGTHKFVGDDAVLITVGGVCDEDLCAAKSVVVDSTAPAVELKAKAAKCDCDDSYALTITTEQLACVGCVTDPDCCKDAGSGLASWNVQIFDADPWKTPDVDPCDPCTEECPPCCSDNPCIDPIAELDGTACPIVVTTECIEKVWAEVDGVNQWVTYFGPDKWYWVIATLTDNVGNKTTYKGIVTPSTDKTKNYVYNFAEIYHPTDKTWCWCYAEDWSDADDILGDCDGTPATDCYAPELKSCPELTLNGVTVDPNESAISVSQGIQYEITLDYGVQDAEGNDLIEKPDCVPSVYVGPSIKTFASGIPEDAQELTVVDNDDDTYTAIHTFGQAGTDYIYVTDCCEDCTPCKYAVEVAERVCPVIEVDGAVLYLGDMWVDEANDHDVTITFASPIPIEKVRAFRVGNLENDWEHNIIPEDAQELILSTEDDLVYTATARFTSHDECDEDYIIVQYGESCCPVICTEMFMVDDEEPCVELALAIVNCSDCDTACAVWISSDTCAYADPADPCCVPTTDCCDECTTFDWTLTVYDDQPFEEDACGACVANDCANVIAADTGTGCPVDLDIFGCLTEDEWAELETAYYVVFEAVDIVGNTFKSYGVLEVDTGECNATELYNSVAPSTGSCNLVKGTLGMMGSCSCPE